MHIQSSFTDNLKRLKIASITWWILKNDQFVFLPCWNFCFYLVEIKFRNDNPTAWSNSSNGFAQHHLARVYFRLERWTRILLSKALNQIRFTWMLSQHTHRFTLYKCGTLLSKAPNVSCNILSTARNSSIWFVQKSTSGPMHTVFCRVQIHQPWEARTARVV